MPHNIAAKSSAAVLILIGPETEENKTRLLDAIIEAKKGASPDCIKK